MTRFHSLRVRLLSFGAATLVLAVWLIFRPSASSTVTTESLPALFPGFAGANATSILLEKRGGKPGEGGKAPAAVRIERRREQNILGQASETWVVASAFDYPAKESAPTRLFSELANARVAAEATQRAATFAEYADGGAWTYVTIKDAQDRVLAAFAVGSTSYAAHETHVLREDGTPRVLRVRGFDADAARAASEAWLETRTFPGVESDTIEQIQLDQRVELDGKSTTRTILLTRLPATEPAKPGEPAPERGWVMRKPEEGPASRADVSELVRAFTGLLFEDVIDTIDLHSKADLAKHGLDQPEVVVTALLKPQEEGQPNPVLRLTVGKKDKETNLWHVLRRDNIGVTDDTWVFTVKENDYSTGRFRADPTKFKEAPKPPEPKEPAKDGAPPAPDMGSPDGPPGGAPKEPGTPPATPPAAPPVEPKPVEPKPGEPAPPEPKKPEEPKKPGELPPAPKEPAPPEKPGGASK